MAFDGIVTKAICSELSSLTGARIDKIFEPNKNNIVIGMYINGVNYALNICIEAQSCRLHLTTHPLSNPQVAPNFCMVLRKNLIGLHLKNIYSLDLERLIVLEFEGFDDIDDILNKKLIIELMGKHSNVILLDEQNIIIDSLRHIKNDDEKHRDILPHTRYSFPTSNKQNFLEIKDFDAFYSLIISNINKDPESQLSTIISSTFNGISKSFIDNITIELGYNLADINKSNNINDYLRQIYDYILNIINLVNTNKLYFSTINKSDGSLKDYYLTTTENEESEKYNIFPLNFYIDDFYYKKETLDNFKNYRNSLLKLILGTLQKYNKRLIHINQKLKDCEDMEKYKIYGELITVNLYHFDANSNLESITVDNYYDNNKKLQIPLDKRYSVHINAKKYFKKYSKLKNALEIVGIQKKETEQELNYIQSVVYELENAKTIDELSEIYDEICENDIFQLKTSKDNTNLKRNKIKKSKLTKNKTVSFNPIKYTIDGYTVLVGRNNKENDYLTLKYANKSDIWFHVKDFHGSHTILKFFNDKNHPSKYEHKNILDLIPNDLICKVAKLAVMHSKAKNSSNVPVDYCEVRYVKKPNGSKPGMVIYTNNRTINCANT